MEIIRLSMIVITSGARRPRIPRPLGWESSVLSVLAGIPKSVGSGILATSESSRKDSRWIEKNIADSDKILLLEMAL